MELIDLNLLLVAASFASLAKQLAVSLLALINGILALIAGIAIWRSYLLVASKILLTLLIFIPVVGILVYVVWGQKRVRAAG